MSRRTSAWIEPAPTSSLHSASISNSHAQAAAPSPPSNIHRGQPHPTCQSLLVCISARSADAGRRQQQDGPGGKLTPVPASPDVGAGARSWAIGAARDSAVGAVRSHLRTSIDARADYRFDPGASTKAASTRCAIVAICESGSVGVAAPSFGCLTSMSPLPLAPRLALTGPARSPLPYRRTLAAAVVCRRSAHRLRRMGDNRGVAGACSGLRESGFVWFRSALASPAVVFAKSQELVAEDSRSACGDRRSTRR